MPAPTADRNLVFGLLALQMDFIGRDQLLEAMHAWMLQKQTPLGEILRQRGAIDEGDRADLDRLVDRHVRRHRGDVRASLAALRVESEVRSSLARLDDADIQASLGASCSTGVESPPTIPPAAPAAPSAGRYRRLRSHARGGLGEVHVARDEELGREVALKEIQDRFADHPDSRARFVREAEVTGHLEHPGIVPVYGLGVYPDGRPYYAMRFIHGESLHERVARFHKGDADPRRDPGDRSLALRDLLNHFLVVCQAVGYAHARGVIHRDLKPANIMLGEFGETLVVDWGLARVLDRPDPEATTAQRPVPVGSGSASAPTEMGQVVGTPAYMPPEQAQGQLDRVSPASDVFSLGATLYAVLTGQAPYQGDALEQARRGEAPPARQRNRRAPAALEAVCARAMAVRPEDRYASPQALADEVKRWLADEPVHAHREPLATRLRRWARRNKTLVTAGVVLLAAGVVGLASGLWAVQVQKAETVKALNDSEFNRTAAERHFSEARGTVDSFLIEISRQELRNIPGLQPKREEFARQALARYQKYAQERPDDRDVAAGLARAHLALGMILGQIGSVKSTEEHLGEAIAIQERLLADRPDSSEWQLDLATTRFELARFHWEIEQYETSGKEVRAVIDSLDRLIVQEPENTEAQLRLALAYNLLGNVDPGNNAKEQQTAYERSRDLFGSLLDSHPRKADVLRGLSAPLFNLARIESRKGQLARALELYRLSHQHNEEARRLLPGMPELEAGSAIGLRAQANMLLKLGRQDESLAMYEEAATRGRTVVRANVHVSRYRWLLADDLFVYAKALSTAGKYEDSKNRYEESAGLLEELVEQVPDRAMYGTKLIEVLEQLSWFHHATRKGTTTSKDAAERIRYLDRAIAVGRKLSKRFPREVDLHAQLLSALGTRAQAAADDGTQDAATLVLFDEILATFRKHIWEVQRQPDSYEVGRMLQHARNAVDCAVRLKRDDKVLDYTESAHQMGKGCTRGEGTEELCALLLTRAATLRKAGRQAEAIATCRDLLRVGNRALEKEPWQFYTRSSVRAAHGNLAEMYEHLDDPANEVLAHREALRVWSGPVLGMKIDPDIDPKRPADRAEARRLRALRRLEPTLLNVTVHVDFDGLRYPLRLFAVHVPRDGDPLADQARWLSENRGGKIPAKIRTGFRTANRFAHDRNVPFGMMIRAIPLALERNIPVAEACEGVLNDPSYRRPLLEDRIAKLEATLEILPHDERLQVERLRVARALAANHGLRYSFEARGAARALTTARQAAEALVRARPGDSTRYEQLARVYLDLADAHAAAESLATAGHAYRRVIDIVRYFADTETPWRTELLGQVLRRVEGRSGISSMRSVAAVEAGLLIADLYDEGRLLRANPKQAAQLRRALHFRRGQYLLDRRRPDEALADLRRSVELDPDNPRAFRALGQCYSNLGRWDDAAIHLRHCFDVTPRDEETPWVVLLLLESLICSDQPQRALAFFDTLAARRWRPVSSPADSYKFEVLLQGFRTLSLLAAGRDSGPEQGKLTALLEEPNRRVRGWSWDELDRWARTQKPPRRDPIETLLAALRAPTRELTTPYYPLRPGSSWTYILTRQGQTQTATLRLGERETFQGREYYRLHNPGNVPDEYLAVEPDGVYRQMAQGEPFFPHIRFLPLPAKAGEKWEVKTRQGREEIVYRGVSRFEDVTVPAGKFTRALVVEMHVRQGLQEVIATIWYGEGVGPVKLILKFGELSVTQVLEKYVPGKDPTGKGKKD